MVTTFVVLCGKCLGPYDFHTLQLKAKLFVDNYQWYMYRWLNGMNILMKKKHVLELVNIFIDLAYYEYNLYEIIECNDALLSEKV